MRSVGRLAIGLLTSGLLFALPAVADAKTYTYRVRHLHTIGGCQGLLKVSETEVRYDSDYRSDARIWTYANLRSVNRDDLRKLTVRTYEAQSAQLGRGKPFTFEFMDGDITDEFFAFLESRVGHAGPPSPPGPPPGGRWEIAAKHQHLFGGCEGALKITPTHIEYVTDNPKDGRLWRYIDIKRFDNPSAYRLTIYTYEDQRLQFGRDKIFRFELKEPLEPQMYDYIRAQMNR
jgi:hypothetical protein